MRWQLATLSFVAYFLCLILPAVNATLGLDDELVGLSGFQFLLTGWVNIFLALLAPDAVVSWGLIDGVASLSWLANPLYWVAIVLFMLNWLKSAVLMAASSLCLGITYWFASSCYCGELLQKDRESFTYHLAVGYWLWLLSFVVVLVGAIAHWVAHWHKRGHEGA